MPLSFRDVLKTKDAQGHGSNARGGGLPNSGHGSPELRNRLRSEATAASYQARSRPSKEAHAVAASAHARAELAYANAGERSEANWHSAQARMHQSAGFALRKAAADPAKAGAAATKASTAAFTENTPQSHMAAHQAHMDACAAYEAVPQTQSTQRAIQHHTSRADDHFESAKGAANQASEDARTASGAIGKADEFAAALLKRVATSLESEETPEAFRADIQTLIAKFKESEAGDSDTVTIVKLGGDDQQIVWGWGLVSTEKNHPLTDLQGDIVDTGDLQKAVHETFMDNGRVGKMMHAGRQVGEIVDSIVFTKDLQRALGIDLGKEGWFVGYKVTDPKVWSLVKRGVLKAFSIGGTGERHPVVEKHAGPILFAMVLGKAWTDAARAAALAARKASSHALATGEAEDHRKAATAHNAASRAYLAERGQKASKAHVQSAHAHQASDSAIRRNVGHRYASQQHEEAARMHSYLDGQHHTSMAGLHTAIDRAHSAHGA